MAMAFFLSQTFKVVGWVVRHFLCFSFVGWVDNRVKDICK